jgi:hypothetical protein
MPNPADEAAVLAAQANADASRTYATGISGTATENYQRFQETAEQALAARYVMYAKSGNVSTEVGELPASAGTVVGSKESEEYKAKKSELEAAIDQINKDLEPYTPETAAEDMARKYRSTGEKRDALIADLEALGEDPANLPDIRANAALGHLSGSDLLTEVGYRDLAQRHANTQLRTAQNQAVAAVEQAENFDTQAGYLEDAATWETWSSILGVGMTVLGGVLTLTGMPQIGIPLVTAGIAQATS